MALYFGIDTSNYTTSAALLSGTGALVQHKRLLPVREGQLGLRQSDAEMCIRDSHRRAWDARPGERCERRTEPYSRFCHSPRRDRLHGRCRAHRLNRLDRGYRRHRPCWNHWIDRRHRRDRRHWCDGSYRTCRSCRDNWRDRQCGDGQCALYHHRRAGLCGPGQ